MAGRINPEGYADLAPFGTQQKKTATRVGRGGPVATQINS